MRRRLISKKLYTYSVKYNYVGGKIYANDSLVGTITDVDIPVEFESENKEVYLTVTGAPETKITENIIGTEEIEGFPYANEATEDAVKIKFYNRAEKAISATITFGSGIECRYFVDKTKREQIEEKTTTYSSPAPISNVKPGNYQLEYSSSTSTRTYYRDIETTTEETFAKQCCVEYECHASTPEEMVVMQMSGPNNPYCMTVSSIKPVGYDLALKTTSTYIYENIKITASIELDGKRVVKQNLNTHFGTYLG